MVKKPNFYLIFEQIGTKKLETALIGTQYGVYQAGETSVEIFTPQGIKTTSALIALRNNARQTQNLEMVGHR